MVQVAGSSSCWAIADCGSDERRLTSNVTATVISHRFSSARTAGLMSANAILLNSPSNPRVWLAAPKASAIHP